MRFRNNSYKYGIELKFNYSEHIFLEQYLSDIVDLTSIFAFKIQIMTNITEIVCYMPFFGCLTTIAPPV